MEAFSNDLKNQIEGVKEDLKDEFIYTVRTNMSEHIKNITLQHLNELSKEKKQK